jgi:hypothetical protein
MQTAANTSRFLTGCSSSVGSPNSEIVVSRGGFLQHIVASQLARTVHSRELFVKLTNELIRLAEQAYNIRDVDALGEVSRILMNLPVDGARRIGTYYYALAINRKGNRDEAEGLLETIADDAPMSYRARAIQTLGGNQHDKGQLNEALRFQLEALRMASDRNATDLQTTLLARWEISIIKSLEGDHKGALSDLKSLNPLVCLAAKQKPFFFYAFQVDLAIDLGDLGRLAEAEAALDVALASPYASAYPNWAETRQELAAKRTSATPSVVAISRKREASPSPQGEPQRHRATSPILAFNWLASGTHAFQIASISIPATATSALNATSTLDRVLVCIGPRAPPARF